MGSLATLLDRSGEEKRKRRGKEAEIVACLAIVEICAGKAPEPLFVPMELGYIRVHHGIISS